jgi:benzodiazapine receptor
MKKRALAFGILNALLIVAVIVVNTLAVVLPLNGRSTGAISDSFKALFVPAGYVFSIWGLIYIGLAAYGVYQLLPSQQANPQVRATDGWFALSSIANCAWIFSWHYGVYWLSLGLMIVLLVSLLVMYTRIHAGSGMPAPSIATRLLVRLPFSIYLGWISVATIANASDVFSWAGFTGFGIPDTTWVVALCVVAALLSVGLSFRFRDIGYAGVILWALCGIIVKQAAYRPIVIGCWVAIGLTIIGIAAGFAARPRRAAARPG